jgi:hypothetical protein
VLQVLAPGPRLPELLQLVPRLRPGAVPLTAGGAAWASEVSDRSAWLQPTLSESEHDKTVTAKMDFIQKGKPRAARPVKGFQCTTASDGIAAGQFLDTSTG